MSSCSPAARCGAGTFWGAARGTQPAEGTATNRLWEPTEVWGRRCGCLFPEEVAGYGGKHLRRLQTDAGYQRSMHVLPCRCEALAAPRRMVPLALARCWEEEE